MSIQLPLMYDGPADTAMVSVLPSPSLPDAPYAMCGFNCPNCGTMRNGLMNYRSGARICQTCRYDVDKRTIVNSI